MSSHEPTQQSIDADKAMAERLKHMFTRHTCSICGYTRNHSTTGGLEHDVESRC